MFNFDFDIDDDPSDEFSSFSQSKGGHVVEHNPVDKEDHCTELLLDDLLSALPPAISFSPLSVPLSSGRTMILPRRDLFDARFQVISLEESEDPSNAKHTSCAELKFLDAPSDLVPGVYEGGLKTWECSLDLVDYLDSIYGSDPAATLRGKRVLELGCGTAVPTLYLLHHLFSAEPLPDAPAVELHLQDYNELVLQLLTLPNMLLAWYTSTASTTFRAAAALPPADPTVSGELSLSSELAAAFRASLRVRGVALRVFAGAWAAFAPPHAYDLVLTAETIYRVDSLPGLVDLLWRACAGGGQGDRAAVQLASADAGPRYLCLVAAKRVYFGVGGGIAEFVRAVEAPHSVRGAGAVQTVWERSEGVMRSVVRVAWAAG